MRVNHSPCNLSESVVQEMNIITMMLSEQRCLLAALLLLWLLASPLRLVGADSGAAGREIFRRLCVKCHGKNGEGVKGKYDEALHGDWSLEKLTRYIDKNMPDDAPEKCVGADAEAVARYIYDAFYSREARARNHPA